MTTTADYARTDELTAKANRHLWGHFARHGMGIEPPIITRGEGVHIYDSYGKRYFDGLSGLFTCQVGHGRKELGEAAAKQAETLEFFPLWSYATEPAIHLAERHQRDERQHHCTEVKMTSAELAVLRQLMVVWSPFARRSITVPTGNFSPPDAQVTT